MIKVKIHIASDDKYEQMREFKDLSEMLEWGLKLHDSIIIDKWIHDDTLDYKMTIYDDYVE